MGVHVLEDIPMAAPLVSDALWERIESLLPSEKPRRFRFPGRKPIDRRKVLAGIIFVLKTGIPWEQLPQEMGCGCGMTCWNYLQAWQKAGVWKRLHEVLLAELQEADGIDWSRAAVDSSHARALGGGEKTGKNPTDRGKPGTKHHIVTDGQGIPLAVTITGSNIPDVKEVTNVIDSIPEVPGHVGHPRKRPDTVYADRGYDSDPHRAELRARSIKPEIARRNTEHGSGLGVYRWVVERTVSWLHSFRRLRLRTDRTANIHEAFVALGSSLICMWFL
jgi:transposase